MSAQLIEARHDRSSPFGVQDEYSDCDTRNGPRPRVIVSPMKPEALSREGTHSSWNTNHCVESENVVESVDQFAKRKGANGLVSNHVVAAKRNSKATVCILPEEKPLHLGEPLFPNTTASPKSSLVSGKLQSKTLPERTMSCVFDAPTSKKQKHVLGFFGALRRGSVESATRPTPALLTTPLEVIRPPASPILLGRSRSATLPPKQPAPAESRGTPGASVNGGELRHAQCGSGLPPTTTTESRSRKVDTKLPLQRSTTSRPAKLETVPGSPAPHTHSVASTMPNPRKDTDKDAEDDRELPPFPVLDDIVPATQSNLRARRLRNSSSAGGHPTAEMVLSTGTLSSDPECADLPPVPVHVPPGWTEEPAKVKPRHLIRKGHTFTEGELRGSHQAPADWVSVYHMASDS